MSAKKILEMLEEDYPTEHKKLEDELHELNKKIKSIKSKYPEGSHVDKFSNSDFHEHSKLVIERGHLWDKIEKLEKANGTYKGY